MKISLLRSRNGLRYYLLRGIMLSLMLVLVLFGMCIAEVYRSGNRVLPAQYHADAAVVLGAAAWDKRPSPVFQERINHAIALYQAGRVDKLVFTGGTPKKGFMTEAEVGRRYALKQGVPARDILFENTSRDTYQNLLNIKPLLREHDIADIVIVTDPYHTARAAVMARDLGLQAETSGTPTSRYSESRKKMHFLLQESYSLFGYYAGKWGNRVLQWLNFG
ncbi:YdcF family protein [Uruburuella testudinis]|uniref:YdcF family protein n=1 Tax=Uruburuella testudinis TaxID=1282863 RepID=A0ABY4DU32_9NEIS|nr:YdcF family protein [Uruburuella testudinis]UOO82214.1 YdcF family protein [Uruburuella testudinis]